MALSNLKPQSHPMVRSIPYLGPGKTSSFAARTTAAKASANPPLHSKSPMFRLEADVGLGLLPLATRWSSVQSVANKAKAEMVMCSHGDPTIEAQHGKALSWSMTRPIPLVKVCMPWRFPPLAKSGAHG